MLSSEHIHNIQTLVKKCKKLNTMQRNQRSRFKLTRNEANDEKQKRELKQTIGNVSEMNASESK